ncbi:hypothetical protein LQM11_004470 [Vibrio parahaemolyticus]|nr:hypothetical protein [Vibrio parahaemolyticus]
MTHNTEHFGIEYNESLENIHKEFEKQGLEKPFIITVPEDITPELLSEMINSALLKRRPIVIYGQGMLSDKFQETAHSTSSLTQ